VTVALGLPVGAIVGVGTADAELVGGTVGVGAAVPGAVPDGAGGLVGAGELVGAGVPGAGVGDTVAGGTGGPPAEPSAGVTLKVAAVGSLPSEFRQPDEYALVATVYPPVATPRGICQLTE